jgi:hypothetical protein
MGAKGRHERRIKKGIPGNPGAPSHFPTFSLASGDAERPFIQCSHNIQRTKKEQNRIPV